MRKAYAAVRDVAATRKIDFRTTAYVLAITRAGKAAVSRYHSIKGVKFWVARATTFKVSRSFLKERGTRKAVLTRDYAMLVLITTDEQHKPV